jgi:hypothetical protein
MFQQTPRANPFAQLLLPWRREQIIPRTVPHHWLHDAK